VLVLSCSSSEFLCGQDADCGNVDGAQCIHDHCAFPNDECPSGLEFGAHSGSLSGQCVEPVGGTTDGSATADDDGPGTNPTLSTDPDADATVDSSASATVDDSDVESTDGPMTGDALFRDDELAGEFGDGTFAGLEYGDGRVRLEQGETSGTFVSRVFDAGAPVQWQTLAWAPDAPYAKPLPDGGMAELGYAEGNVDMLANVVLFHLDITGALAADAILEDASGRGNDGTLVGDGGESMGVAGVFGSAMADHLDAYVSIPAGTADLDFGEADFTWATWFRFSHACTNNNVFIGVDDVIGGSDAFPHLWMGCTDDAWVQCPDDATMPRPGGVLRSVHNLPDDGAMYCGDGPIADDAWHHMAITKVGHPDAVVTLYVDGSIAAQVDATFAESLDLTQDGDFAFGGFSGGTYPTEGTFDDIAIWTRALAADEIAALHRRGALRVELAVRVCAEPACADDPEFVGGPSLDAAGVFADPPDALAPGTELDITGLVAGRWAQYRLEYVGTPTASPALAAVTLRGTFVE
jgi:hypothetical protein